MHVLQSEMFYWIKKVLDFIETFVKGSLQESIEMNNKLINQNFNYPNIGVKLFMFFNILLKLV